MLAMKKYLLLLMICFCIFETFSQTTIGSYNFDNGFQGWTDGGDDAGLNTSSNYACSSSGSVYSRDNDTGKNRITSPNLALSGYGSVDISFCYKSDGLNTNEGFNLQYYNGNSWSILKTYKLGTDFSSNNTAYNFSYSLRKCNITFPTAANFRFSGTGDSNNQINYFDNVVITGYTNDINILGNGNSILNGDAVPTNIDNTDFGSVAVSAIVTNIFTIENLGSSLLNLTGTPIISVSGNAAFTVSMQPSGATIASCSSRTFSVKFNPTVSGVQSAIISIANNDANENPYTFTVQGQAEQNFYDSDGDGVFDNIDIDDDNDGIRDDLEEGNCRITNGQSVTYKFLNETFGAGNRTTINTTYAATTTYIYESGGDLNDGEYTVGSSAQIASWANDYWYMGGDHTPGDTNGRMAMFNADNTPGIFYTATISGALPNIPITYSFWAINLDRTDASQNPIRALPNIKVEFRDLSNNLLETVNTGDISLTTVGNLAGDWRNFTANLNLPVSAFKVIFINNKPGGIGNDLAIDDIEIKQTLCDTDNDGVADVFDLDSDNDGIPDILEAGLGHLSNGTGRIVVAWIDANNNGLHDSAESIIINAASIPDSDGDGVPNYLDLDSDNDSIFDVDESGAGNSNATINFVNNYENGDGDINGDGVGNGLESETFRNKDTNGDGIMEGFGDGILDIYDYGTGANQYGNLGQGLTGTGWKDYVKDTDNDGTPDYLDTKSNGITFDIAGTLYASLDNNGDGKIDGNTDIDHDGILDAFDTNTAVFGSPRNLNQKLHLYFDGRNDYIEEDNGANIVNGLSQATMMAWVKLDPNFSKNGAIMGQTNFWIRINGSRRLSVEIPDTKPFATPSGITLLSLNIWTHVAAVFEGSNTSEKVKLYINGEKVASTNPTGLGATIPTSSNTKFRIGRAPSNLDINNTTPDMFKGEMDEVRVFNKALTEEELQKMVYQELNDVNGFNSGVVIPREISPTIGANLVRYFRMDTYKDDILDNLKTPVIDALTGAKLYNIKNIYPQTAPLPYETKADGDWSNVASWLHGGVWDIASEATNKDWAIVHIKNDVTTSKRHSTSGLIVDATKKLSIKTSKELKNTWYLELDGFIDLEDESQLVQTENSILDQDSGGFIERDQQGTANSFNYNYWSSSVGAITPLGINQKGTGVASTNASHKLVDILMDGTIASEPNKNGIINFLPTHGSADAGITTPIIISSYWLYTFNGTDNSYGAWKSINKNTALLAGEGYTMKGTSGAVNIGNQQNYVFKGKPNNGDFTLYIAPGNDRLIGNPYPSAMDADEFIKDNIKETINSKVGSNKIGNIFNGALYFWDHFGERNTHILREYVGGYATFTLMGGAKAIASDSRINTTSGLLSWKMPQRYIPVNQGFFVIAALELNPAATYTTPTIDGGDIVFKNNQRIFMPESISNSVFMKGVNAKRAHTSEEKEKDTIENYLNLDKRPKIWLQFDSPTGYHRQLLVGVDENTSNFFDLGYDAPIADIGKEDMFWVFDGGKFVIQAVNNFNTGQELPLGLVVSKKGLARIKIDDKKNMDENISAHIKDKLTGEIHNISHKPFEINLEAGTYLNRFALTFKMQKLIAEDLSTEVLIPAEMQLTNEGIQVFMDNTIREIQIKNNSNDEIVGIVLYNYLGQTIKTWNANFKMRTNSFPLNIAAGVYLVKISTKKNKTFTRRIVVR